MIKPIFLSLEHMHTDLLRMTLNPQRVKQPAVRALEKESK